jgi:hypothetical protein
MIPSCITREMVWSEMLGSVSEPNLLWSKSSCVSVAMLDMLQLCKLNCLIQLLLLLVF